MSVYLYLEQLEDGQSWSKHDHEAGSGRKACWCILMDYFSIDLCPLEIVSSHDGILVSGHGKLRSYSARTDYSVNSIWRKVQATQPSYVGTFSRGGSRNLK